MFQTGDRDGAHIALFRRAVHNTNVNSLTGEVYKAMPNDTDFTVSRAAGFPGYNFAFIGKEFDYHSPSSTPAVLDQGSLQHMGDQTLALTRALIHAEQLPAQANNTVYFVILGHAVVAYPAVLGGWLLFGLSLLVGGVAVWQGQRRDSGHGVRIGPVVWGFVGSLLITILTGAVLWAAHQLIGLGDSLRHRALIAQYPQFFWGFMLIAIGLALFLVGPVQRGHAWTLLIGKTENRWSHWAGASLPLVLLALVLQLNAPPTGSLWVWPLASTAVLMAIIAFAGRGRFEGLASLMAAGALGALFVVQNGATANFIFTAVGEMAPELLVLFVFLSIPALFPLLTLWGRGGAVTQLGSIVVTLAGAGLLVFAATHSPWSARLPKPVQAFYLQDAVANKAWIASGLDKLDPWSAKALGGKPDRRPVEALNGTFWQTPAPLGDGQPPQFTSTREGDAVVVQITPRAGGRELRLTLSSTAPVSNVTLNGKATSLLAAPNKPSYVRWAAPGDGLTLRFTPQGKGELDLKYAEVKDGWPAVVQPPPKPSDVAPSGLSDTSVLIHELKTRF